MSRNRLDQETSPYLLQHRDNPVHWWAWGPEALAEARRTGKPILLSVGYAACHWCHVMAHESFEDPETATLMNRLFINIKVDREERPDIDALYMSALHMLGEQGGWPLTMFLDSEARPFWGGTYFPPQDRYGRPSFRRVLTEIARLHRDEPDRVGKNAGALIAGLTRAPAKSALANLGEPAIAELARKLAGAVDPVRGGLQGAPKFPQFPVFWLLWRAGIRLGVAEARNAVLTTLDNLCQGGIYDHLGGGFARYSVDERWLIPHFEKMLYDNALLLQLMVEAWRETGSPLLQARIEETAGFVLAEMTVEGGGFASSWDADSEGEEGKYYVWSRAEVDKVLGPEDAALFARIYDITVAGNFEGHNIPNRLGKLALEDAATEARLAGMRTRLLAVRRRRVPPGFDDKVLADWNGLMIEALARASRALDRPEWLQAARTAYGFVVDRLQVDGRLRHAFRAGIAKAPAIAPDYANMISAALTLHEVTGAPAFLDDARRWLGILDRHYWLAGQGGYALTADDAAGLIARTRSGHDDATPNANAVMLSALMRLYLLTGEEACRERAGAILEAYAEELSRAPSGFTGLLAGALDLLAPQHLVLIGDFDRPEMTELRRTVSRLSLPGALEQLVRSTEGLPTASPLAGKLAIEGRPTAYFCVGATCSLPVTAPDALRELLERRRSGGAAGA